jgi:hypothetical protein
VQLWLRLRLRLRLWFGCGFVSGFGCACPAGGEQSLDFVQTNVQKVWVSQQRTAEALT